jgi:hypothetical protein
MLTMPQTILLLAVVLPRRHFELNWVIEVISYRQARNNEAYQSHRRRRLKHLPQGPPMGNQTQHETSL